jgi:hypothetical protein
MRLLGEQRKRCYATILTSAETSPWWSKLTATQQQTYRENVRSALTIFYDLTRDIVKISDEDEALRNQHALELIRAVHTQTTHISEALSSTR